MKTNKGFVEAMKRGDAASCAAVYVDNARALPPNSPMVSGKQQIKKFWQGVLKTRVKNLTLKTVELLEKGDTAIEIGAYTLDTQPKGSKIVKDTGKYVVVWKRQTDGSWKYLVDIWNGDTLPGKR